LDGSRQRSGARIQYTQAARWSGKQFNASVGDYWIPALAALGQDDNRAAA
jgi:hypothetical protein